MTLRYSPRPLVEASLDRQIDDPPTVGWKETPIGAGNVSSEAVLRDYQRFVKARERS